MKWEKAGMEEYGGRRESAAGARLTHAFTAIADDLDQFLNKCGHVAPTNVTSNLHSARDDLRRSDSIAGEQGYYGGAEETPALDAWSNLESAIDVFRHVLGLEDVDD